MKQAVTLPPLSARSIPRGVSRPFDRCLSLWIPHGRDRCLAGATQSWRISQNYRLIRAEN